MRPPLCGALPLPLVAEEREEGESNELWFAPYQGGHEENLHF